MTRKTIQPRALLIIVSVITVLLLGGSFILNRIVFKAEPVNTALFFSPQLTNVKPESEFISTIKTSLDKPAWLAALELNVVYDENLLRPLDFVTLPGWETQKVTTSNNLVHWAILPSPDRGTIVELNGEQALAQIKWKGLKNGTQTLKFEPSTTMMMAVDAQNSPSLYNAVASYQDAIVTIDDRVSATPSVEFKLTDSNISSSNSLGTQKIVAVEAVGGVDTAAVMVSLKYPARVKIEFGLSEALEGSVEVQKIDSHFLVKVAGLQANSTYFYRVVVDDSRGATRYNSPLKTFQTGQAATGTAVDQAKSQLIIFPTSTQQTTNVIAIIRNSNGQVLTEVLPTFTAISGQVKLTRPSQLGGLTFTEATNDLGTRQAARLGVAANNQNISEDTVIFDPNLVDPVEPSYEEADALPWNRQTGLLVGGLVILALFSGLSLMKAARIK